MKIIDNIIPIKKRCASKDNLISLPRNIKSAKRTQITAANKDINKDHAKENHEKEDQKDKENKIESQTSGQKMKVINSDGIEELWTIQS